MNNPWLKCKYCGHEFHAATLEGGMIDNHNCKDRQIADLKEELAFLKEASIEQSIEIMQLGYGVEAYRNEAEALKADLALWKAFWDSLIVSDTIVLVTNHTKALKERGLI